MAAFVLSFISSFLIHRSVAKYAGSNIPLPPVKHVTLHEPFLSKFNEIVVIGDVHGCFDEMKQMLNLIHQGATRGEQILKIFVGDLVNKGPKNREVLELLLGDKNSSHPSILAVRGNHDEVVISETLNWRHFQSIKKKNSWMKELSDDELNYLIDLPYTISIPSLNSIIVHAGLVPGVELQEQNLRDLVTMRNLIIEEKHGKHGVKYSTTERHKPGEAWANVWAGPSHVYFGHDAKRLLQECPFATGLDTGCVYGNHLTALFIKGSRKGQFIKLKATACHQATD